MKNIKTEWVGFCQYRKFFLKKDNSQKLNNFNDLNKSILKNLDINSDFDCILGIKSSVENYKLSKIIKNHFLEFAKNPSKLFFKKKRSLKFHFDLFHGKGNLDKAINLLDESDRESFRDYVNNETSFHPHNMFICKTNILKEYYNVIFPWLKRCESIFGFNNLETYGLKRIYGFLAERYLSYWFSKKYRIKTLPIYVKSLSDYKYL